MLIATTLRRFMSGPLRWRPSTAPTARAHPGRRLPAHEDSSVATDAPASDPATALVACATAPTPEPPRPRPCPDAATVAACVAAALAPQADADAGRLALHTALECIARLPAARRCAPLAACVPAIGRLRPAARIEAMWNCIALHAGTPADAAGHAALDALSAALLHVAPPAERALLFGELVRLYFASPRRALGGAGGTHPLAATLGGLADDALRPALADLRALVARAPASQQATALVPLVPEVIRLPPHRRDVELRTFLRLLAQQPAGGSADPEGADGGAARLLRTLRVEIPRQLPPREARECLAQAALVARTIFDDADDADDDAGAAAPAAPARWADDAGLDLVV